MSLASAPAAIKSTAYNLVRSSGLSTIVALSRWRQKRLLILCYHGISQADEHESNTDLYLPPTLFRDRMQMLRAGGYRVLPLADGVKRLSSGTLPEKAVSITFDDGFVDYYRVAAPILREFGYPATVYVSTRYVEAQLPAFPPILSYVLWKGKGQEAESHGLVSDGHPLRTRTKRDRDDSLARLVAATSGKSPEACDDVAAELAQRLHVDYAAIKARRLFHLMTPDEIAETATGLTDIQLHTHRHVQPRDPEAFHREISDNREALSRLGIPSERLAHFCYPMGETRPELPGWLAGAGIVSATTCVPGIASKESNQLLLPRFIDTQGVSRSKFEAWVSGVAALLPGRHATASNGAGHA